MNYITAKKVIFCILAFVFILSCSASNNENRNNENVEQRIYELPQPSFIDGHMSVENALHNRRSRREFDDLPLTIAEISQILWSAYGVTLAVPNIESFRGGLRTAPSAGAMFPLEIYIVIGNVEGFSPGVYKYDSENHKLILTISGDIRSDLDEATWGQNMVKQAAATIVYTAVFARMTQRYGSRGRERYVAIDLGHSAQNVYLQVESLGLGTCAIGAFHDESVSRLLQLPEQEEPLYLMPIGRFR
jgi:SagB-type dehydrogenase family enzyme